MRAALSALIVSVFLVSSSSDVDAQGWLRKLWKKARPAPVAAAPIEDDQRIVITGPFVGGTECDATNVAAGASNCPLLTSSQILNGRQGGFRLPNASSCTDGHFGFSNTIAYNPNNGRMYVTHQSGDKVAEITIPAVVDTSTVASMNQSTCTQGWVEATEGQKSECQVSGGVGCATNGIAVYGDRLYGAMKEFYDANNEQIKMFWSRPLNLSTTGDVKGVDEFGVDATMEAKYDKLMGNWAGFISLFLGIVPTEWQTALGGYPMFSGMPGTWQNMLNNSYGPAIGTFDPTDIGGGGEPHPWNPLLGYPNTHRTLGRWDVCSETTWGVNNEITPGCDAIVPDCPECTVPDTEYYGIGTEIRGAVMFDGTRTLAFFGRRGETACYGMNTGTLSEHGDPFGNFVYCYDLELGGEGNHGYPYHYSLWLYDLLDLKAVNAGTKAPYEVVPYERVDFTFPISEGAGQIAGATWDAANRRLYVAQRWGDPANGDASIIWRYDIP